MGRSFTWASTKAIAIDRNLKQLGVPFFPSRRLPESIGQDGSPSLLKNVAGKPNLKIVPHDRPSIPDKVIPDEKNSFSRLSIEILPQSIRTHIPVDDKNIHLRVDLFQFKSI
jgi:hypothetical protein